VQRVFKSDEMRLWAGKFSQPLRKHWGEKIKLLRSEALVGFTLGLLDVKIENTFVNQPELAGPDTFQFAMSKQASEVLGAVVTIGSSHLHRYVVV